MRGRISLLIGLSICCLSLSYGQQFSIKGRVTDNMTHKPIYKVILHLSGADGSKDDFKTDTNGFYFIDSSKIRAGVSYELAIITYGEQCYFPTDTNKYIFTGASKNGNVKIFDFQMKKGCCDPVLYFPKVLFDQGITKLTEANKDSLNWMKRILADNPTIVIEVDGHASANEGNKLQKQTMSLARANACKDYLRAQGIDSARIIITGWGDTKPLPGYDQKGILEMKTKAEKEAAYAANRRATFRVLRFDYKPKSVN